MVPNKSWMKEARIHPKYFEGIEEFIKFAKSNTNSAKLPCPCRECCCRNDVALSVMRRHLQNHGMLFSYTEWTMHGEVEGNSNGLNVGSSSEFGEPNSNYYPTMEDMLNDTFPLRGHQNVDHNPQFYVDHGESMAAYDRFAKLMAEAQKPLYEGDDHTVLQLILDSMKAKVESGWSDIGFDRHVNAMKKYLPQPNNCPGSYREVKRILKNLGLSYEVIHACEFGCILYYKEHEALDVCPVCNEPRYEENNQTPRKTVRYFPIIPRLQRLYSSPYIAKEMRWHGERGNIDDDNLRHPADGDAWKQFDAHFKDFSNEIRNVRLCLATDGFSPFSINSTPHSTWPVVVMPYNLPPSMCMKKEYMILALLISGPKSPGKCLNVFMRPLIDELQVLWNTGSSHLIVTQILASV